MPRALTVTRLGWLVVLTGALGSGIACIDDPRLSSMRQDWVASTSPGDDDAAHANMVFVPGIAVDLPSGTPPSSPQGEAKGNAEGGQGKGKKDAGAPPPPPPADAGTTPPEPTPTPTHLEVAGFWIDETEVTVEAFHACVTSGGCAAPAPGAGCTTDLGLGAHPVSCVTIDQARAYCAWRGRRLVTNDEWTAAAAGAELRAYPWGTDGPASDRLNACGPECAATGMYAASDGYAGTAPTGSFPLGRTPQGVLDLAGNVAEWVDDATSATTRGASFEDVDVQAASSQTSRAAPGPTASIGFRCAATP